MEVVKIKKGSIQNVVPIEVFNTLYKSKGWELVCEVSEESDISKEIKDKGIVGEMQQNAYVIAKKLKRKFDDNLFKEE